MYILPLCNSAVVFYTHTRARAARVCVYTFLQVKRRLLCRITNELVVYTICPRINMFSKRTELIFDRYTFIRQWWCFFFFRYEFIFYAFGSVVYSGEKEGSIYNIYIYIWTFYTRICIILLTVYNTYYNIYTITVYYSVLNFKKQ